MCDVFVTCPFGVLGQVWCLIVLIPDLCLYPYCATNEISIFLLVSVAEQAGLNLTLSKTQEDRLSHVDAHIG